MTEEEMIFKAQKLAEERGWTWFEPVIVIKRGSRMLGSKIFEVFSNAEARSMNVSVYFDGETGEIIRAGYIPSKLLSTKRI